MRNPASHARLWRPTLDNLWSHCAARRMEVYVGAKISATRDIFLVIVAIVAVKMAAMTPDVCDIRNMENG